MNMPVGARKPVREITARAGRPAASVRPPSMLPREPELACQPSGSWGNRMGILSAWASAFIAAGVSYGGSGP
jgi:hypothetical protein